MPNGGPYMDDSSGRSREELTSASDIVIVAQKAQNKMQEQILEIMRLEKKEKRLKKEVKNLKGTIETLRALDKGE